MQPEVSIIVATFNAEKHLEHLIQSFLTQTFALKELVIIDGGSTDRTIDIIRKYEQPGINWTSGPDKGIYDALNKGIQLASGNWLYFIGADDYFKNENVLEDIFKQDLSDIDIIYGDVYSMQLKRNYDGPTNPEKLLFSNLCHQSIFYRRSVFEMLGNYSLNFKLFSDWEFNLRCFLNDQIKTKYTNVVIAVYADSGASTIQKDIHFTRKFLFPFNLKYLEQNGFSKFKNIRYYDRWWRLIRSLKLEEGIKEASGMSNGESIPSVIQNMISFQSKFPRKILTAGIFSKALMSVSYIVNILFPAK